MINDKFFFIFLGDAVLKNLQRNGFVVSTIYDIYPEKCKGYDPTVQIKSSPKEVAEESDIIISGMNGLTLSNIFMYNS